MKPNQHPFGKHGIAAFCARASQILYRTRGAGEKSADYPIELGEARERAPSNSLN